MTTTKEIGGGQTDQFRKLAREQGVGFDIFDSALDGGDVSDFLKSLKMKYDPQGLWRIMEDLSIEIPALPQPTLADIQARWPGVTKINFDHSPTEATTLALGTLLRKDEPSIGGAEYERRRKSLSGLYGFQQGVWLEENQDQFPAFAARRGKIYIDLPGIEVVYDGSRAFPFLSGGGERWKLNLLWTDGVLNEYGRVARSRT